MDHTIKISLTVPMYGITFLPLVCYNLWWSTGPILCTLNRELLLIALGALFINTPNATLLNLAHESCLIK